MASDGVRKVCFISYLPQETLLSIIESKSKIIRNFAFIYHDKDIWTDADEKENHDHIRGSPKIPHFHGIFLFYYPYKLSTVQNWFEGFVDDKGKINTFVDKLSSVNSYYRYFTHADNPDKFQYSDSAIVCGDPVDFLDPVDSCEDTAWICLDLMLSGVPYEVIAKRFGRDFIYHYTHIKTLYNDIIYKRSLIIKPYTNNEYTEE